MPTDVPDDEPPLELAPIDPATEAARRRMREFEASTARIDDTVRQPERRRWQFSLGQLILANTVIAVTLALLQWLAPSLVAGAIGVAAYAALVSVTVYQPKRRELYVVAWGLIVLYSVVSLVALLRGVG